MYRISFHISILVPNNLQPDRVALDVAAGGGVVVAEVVVVQAGLGVVILAARPPKPLAQEGGSGG